MARKRENKVLLAIGAGLLVTITGVAIDLSMLPWERATMVNQLIGDFIAGLMAVLITLAIQLKNEEMHYRFAMERAAIVAELNHHVRNAVFPLCVAVQRNADAEAKAMANEAIERINIALKDAAADAFSRKIDYSVERTTTEV